jgi:hypothetical protein
MNVRQPKTLEHAGASAGLQTPGAEDARGQSGFVAKPLVCKESIEADLFLLAANATPGVRVQNAGKLLIDIRHIVFAISCHQIYTGLCRESGADATCCTPAQAT